MGILMENINMYIRSEAVATGLTTILVSDLFLLPWFIFLPNDCHS